MELPSQSWSAAECSSLGQRDLLARFWLACPDDLLESLWNTSGLGQSTCALVKQLTPDSKFSSDQVALRDAIGNQLQAGFKSPGAIQLCLANWLFSPPGLMRIASPEENLPTWLLPAYLDLYEQSQSQPGSQPSQSTAKQIVQPAVTPPDLNFGPFPATLQSLIGDRVQLNRMLGLSNLYYIDPEDQEILLELRDVRIAFAKAIQNCPEDQLEQLWSTELRDRYAAMVRSGLQNQSLNAVETEIKQSVTTKLQPSQDGGFGTPGATNAFLIAMLFYLPGTMQVEGAETKLSPWLFNLYQELFAQALNQAS